MSNPTEVVVFPKDDETEQSTAHPALSDTSGRFSKSGTTPTSTTEQSSSGVPKPTDNTYDLGDTVSFSWTGASVGTEKDATGQPIIEKKPLLKVLQHNNLATNEAVNLEQLTLDSVKYHGHTPLGVTFTGVNGESLGKYYDNGRKYAYPIMPHEDVNYVQKNGVGKILASNQLDEHGAQNLTVTREELIAGILPGRKPGTSNVELDLSGYHPDAQQADPKLKDDMNAPLHPLGLVLFANAPGALAKQLNTLAANDKSIAPVAAAISASVDPKDKETPAPFNVFKINKTTDVDDNPAHFTATVDTDSLHNVIKKYRDKVETTATKTDPSKFTVGLIRLGEGAHQKAFGDIRDEHGVTPADLERSKNTKYGVHLVLGMRVQHPGTAYQSSTASKKK